MLSVDWSWFPALAIGLVTFYFVKYWFEIRCLPPGPLPIPLLGNVLLFLRNKNNVHDLFERLRKRYNGIYTLWAGSVPMVIVADWEMTREGLLTKRNDIISRPEFNSLQHALKHTDAMAFQSNNKQWEVCRKVGFTAVRKFADSDVLATIVHDSVEEMLKNMMSKKSPFNPQEQLQKTTFAIIAQTAFGFNKLSDAETQLFKTNADLFHETMLISPGDFSPLLFPFFHGLENKIRLSLEEVGNFLSERLQVIKKGYVFGEPLRHFADSVIASGIEAEKEESASKEYLTDDHLKKILGDLFLAGTDTTQVSLTWIFLALATYPDIQERVRKEIDDNIGTNFPTQEYKNLCPYTWAFISEILRMRPPVPMLLPHAANVDTSLGGRKIPKGTMVIFDINATHFDPNLWEDPHKLKPERFLDSAGNYSTKKFSGYVPFGEGKRMCIGEKMARNDLFLVIANVMQKARIVYHGPQNRGEMVMENNPLVSLAADYEIKVVPRS